MAVAGGIHSESLLLLLFFQWFVNEFSYESCFTDSSDEAFHVCRKSHAFLYFILVTELYMQKDLFSNFWII